MRSPELCPPRLDPPEELPNFLNFENAPAFTRHYETRLISGEPPGSAASTPDYLVWVRHRDAQAGRSMVGLLALADMLPPAMLATLPNMVPLSSITWQVNFLVTEVPEGDDWRLLLSTAESASGGYSSQNMLMWDRRGVPLLASRQSIAIFDR